MRKVLLILGFLAFFSRGYAQIDSLEANRLVTTANSIGVGGVNILDTYLSPLEYKGTEVRFMNEKMHLTKFFSGHVSAQRIFQANVSYSKNPTEDNSAFSGLVNWSYALHYQFRVNDHLKFLVGPAADMNLGFIYNLNNGNNPASAKLYANLLASGMAIYKFYLGNRLFTARYQANIPLVGLMFAPHYGESYYEIFTLGHNSHLVHFTTPYTQPSFRQMVSLDIPISRIKIRASYVFDMQQSHINSIKAHTWSNIFMIGFVKDLYVLKPSVHQRLSERLKAY